MLKKVLCIASFFLAAGAGEAAAGWSSIAVDSFNARWGWTHNYRGQGEAIVSAQNACGTLNCRTQFFTNAKCIAYAESRAGGFWFGTGAGNTRWRVRDTALSGCSRGAPVGTCRILLDAC